MLPSQYRSIRLQWKKNTKKGIVRCESCVYYFTVMSGLNCFLIVCFYATIVFPCLSFSLCVGNVSEPMQLAVYICQRGTGGETRITFREDLCTCQVAWVFVLKRCQKRLMICCQAFGFRTSSWTTAVRTAQGPQLTPYAVRVLRDR